MLGLFNFARASSPSTCCVLLQKDSSVCFASEQPYVDTCAGAERETVMVMVMVMGPIEEQRAEIHARPTSYH